MTPPFAKPAVKLTEIDSNAFAIMGKVRQALLRAGADHEYVNQYIDQATSGNYDHLLAVTMEYVEMM